MQIIEKNLTKLAAIQTQAKTKYFAKIDSVDELEEVLQFVEAKGLKIAIIGNGTNILFIKEIYDDTVFVKLGKGFDFFDLNEDTVEIGSSYSFMRAGKKLTGFGYEDFVYMALIPSSMGGGVRQNAGTTKEGEVKDNFSSAKVYNLLEKRIEILNRDEMEFSYRNSIIQKQPNEYLVLSVIFDLGKKVDDVRNLLDFVEEKKSAKKEKEPSGYSFGSTFKSLLHEKPAWWYIDQVGLRGHIVGGAKFSEQHTNWIINFDNAKADDIATLISMAKTRINNTFDLTMQEEVELI